MEISFLQENFAEEEEEDEEEERKQQLGCVRCFFNLVTGSCYRNE